LLQKWSLVKPKLRWSFPQVATPENYSLFQYNLRGNDLWETKNLPPPPLSVFKSKKMKKCTLMLYQKTFFFLFYIIKKGWKMVFCPSCISPPTWDISPIHANACMPREILPNPPTTHMIRELSKLNIFKHFANLILKAKNTCTVAN